MNTKNSQNTSTSETNTEPSPVISEDSPETADQRNNFRGTKIARRARSFKEDFFEKISQMRTPTNTISRSHSPKAKNIRTLGREQTSKPSHDLNYHAKQVKHALTHFKDVINKNKLEMLHGNGTIVLESIANVHSALKAQKLNEHNSAIISAKQQAHHSLGNLIRLCDDALLSGNEEIFITLNKETVKETIENLDNAVTNLVSLANEKSDSAISQYSENEGEQRSSLPDIPLTNREKSELENSMMQNSQSSESILQGIVPPPKPSKDRKSAGPPLPPKKKTFSIDELAISFNSAFEDSMANHSSFSRRIDFSSNDEVDESANRDISRSIEENFSSTRTTMSSEEKHFNQSSFSSLTLGTSASASQAICSELFMVDKNFAAITLNDGDFRDSLQADVFDEHPPPLPVKTRSRSLRLDHHKSVYDNIDDMNRNSLDTKISSTSSNSSLTSSLSAREGNSEFNAIQSIVKAKYKSCIESGSDFGSDNLSNNDNPPPLPLKKKHIMAYMEIFGNASHHSSGVQDDASFVRHSVHAFTQNSTKIQSQSSFHTSCLMPKNSQFIPPALPPKKSKIGSSNVSLNIVLTPPVSPNIIAEAHHNQGAFEKLNEPITKTPTNNANSLATTSSEAEDKTVVVLRKKAEEKSTNLMEELEVISYLVFKKDGEDGSEILIGGHSEALIIHATKVQKITDVFGEAFLLTFRTFISPSDLIEKLVYRYNFFNNQNTDLKKRAAKESFSLLVRVVNDLTSPDISANAMESLIKFVYDLVCSGELLMAKLLRVKVIEKTLMMRNKQTGGPAYLPSRPVMSNPPCLVDLKSSDIAEQMTILDAELFQKIEIPEVLVWAQEQNEERSPNLTLFTAHFNKLSYWARTQILKQQDAKDREKYVMKFIKIMKYLRKINNFNSYLALLSALDSAPIRRLEWQKNITEGLNEYCALIDSSSSFRAYRLALSETSPPCIPYIGLVLQDLTFVHIGNPDYLSDLPAKFINFSKRWQQYNIVINMKRFKHCSYTFKKNDRIIGFFDNFDEYFDEDQMWQISEKIKPRGKKGMMN